MQAVPQVASLVATGFLRSEGPGNEFVAAARPSRARDLALDHDAAQGAFGVVVGWLGPRVAQERPQRRLRLQQVGAGGRGTPARGLVSDQGPLDAVLQRLELRGRFAGGAPAKQHIGRTQQICADAPGLAGLARLAGTFADAKKIVDQVRPAELALLGRDVGRSPRIGRTRRCLAAWCRSGCR